MRHSGCVLLSVSLVLWSTLDLHAQENGSSSPSDKAGPAVRRFLDRPIDYWQRGLGFDEETKAPPKSDPGSERKPQATAAASDWGQVVKLPDGSLSYHELPRQLVEVLEDPSPGKIRAYFEWRLGRTQKILRAAELMKEYRTSAALKPADGDPQGSLAILAHPKVQEIPASEPRAETPPPETLSKAPFRVTYFHKQGCPHCDSQDVILTEWLKDKAESKVQAVEFGMNPELWRAYQVRGTPSLVIEDIGTKKSVFLEGLTRPEALDRALLECRLAGSRDAKVKGESNK